MQTPSGNVGTAPVNTTARYIRIQDPGTSTSLTLSEVELVNNQDPTVSLTAPANGASFTAPGSISYRGERGRFRWQRLNGRVLPGLDSGRHGHELALHRL